MRRALPMLALIAALAITDAAAADDAALTDAELDVERGAIMTPMGFEIGFGASVKTYVDGALALETRLTWAPGGVVTEQVPGGALPPGVSVGALADFQGVRLGDGVTWVAHELAAERIGSVVLNSANGRNIRQEIDIALRLPGLPELQQQIAAARLVDALASARMLNTQP